MSSKRHLKNIESGREKIELAITDADLIKIFQDNVRDRAKAGEEAIEFPTDLLMSIADLLDHVKISGRRPRSLNESLIEILLIKKARAEYRRLRSAGYDPLEALRRIKRWPAFKSTALTTLKADLQRRKYR
jgi:hypothetical protein